MLTRDTRKGGLYLTSCNALASAAAHLHENDDNLGLESLGRVTAVNCMKRFSRS